MKRSSGSWLGGFSGFFVVIMFFLPWVRACGSDYSGYDLATSSRVEEPWFYWLTLAAGIIVIALFLFVNTSDTRTRLRVAVLRLGVALLGFLPLVNIWYNVQERGSALEILYGGWATAAGYLGMFLSFFVDLGGRSAPVEKELDYSTDWD